MQWLKTYWKQKWVLNLPMITDCKCFDSFKKSASDLDLAWSMDQYYWCMPFRNDVISTWRRLERKNHIMKHRNLSWKINIGNLVLYLQGNVYLYPPFIKKEVFDLLERVGGNYGEVCKVKISLKKFLLTDSFPSNFTFMIHMRQTSATTL